MFKFDEICELIRLVGTSGVANLEIERSGERVHIEGPCRQTVVGPALPPVPAESEARAASVPPPQLDAAPAAAEDENIHQVTSPIVGTFYRAPSPEADPYVKPGDVIHKGQVLCIVEAMKLMNEIESDVDGTIVEIAPENAQPVEFGERLFSVRVG
jgi:acetyl-CoA carboxylase biotin carboxyl carrier protein